MERHHDDNEQASASLRPIRLCSKGDVPAMLRIINAAAEAYRGVIPADRWHDPYMPPEELRAEMSAGVAFTGYTFEGALVGVMGIERLRNVDLVRHAYVLPERQGLGIGSKLIEHLRTDGVRPLLVGTWQAAIWAIRFYERHGFGLVPHESIGPLLRTYWRVPDRQIETSVVLASPILSASNAARLIDADDRLRANRPR